MNTEHMLPTCPVKVTMSLIDERWKVFILRELLYGTKRFSQLQKALDGVSSKVLSSNLKQMEKNGLLTRKIYPEIPPKVEYSLTDLGYSLKPILFAMIEWGLEYKKKIDKQTPIRANNGDIILLMKSEKSEILTIAMEQNINFLEVYLQKLNRYESVFIKAMDSSCIKIVGYIGGYIYDNILHIPLIFVLPEFRRQNIGYNLVNELEKTYPYQQYQIYDSNKKPFIEFYKKCQYFKSHQTEDFITFKKEL